MALKDNKILRKLFSLFDRKNIRGRYMFIIIPTILIVITLADIFIYNYSRSCTLEGVWNEATLQCRGIIVDKDYNILARPFEKFFN